ncbi:hypothetical protein [Acidisoma sp. C75]
MTNRFSRSILASPLLLGLAAAPAFAATPQSVFDPAQMPTIHGVVAQYDLSPRGDVDGLILTDGTEVHVPPHLGPQLRQAIKAGDSVTIHGLRARVLPLVEAMSVTDDRTGQTIVDAGPGGPPPRPRKPHHPPGPPPALAGNSVQLHDTVKMPLHGPRGEVNGVLLANGTIVHMPPPAAERFAALLTTGTAISVSGNEITADAGRVIAATAIGPADGALQPIAMEPPPPPGGPAADGNPPPPPAAPPGAPPAQ